MSDVADGLRSLAMADSEGDDTAGATATADAATTWTSVIDLSVARPRWRTRGKLR